MYYIPTSAEDVTKVYKNTTTLSFDELLFDMIKSFGSSHSMTQKLFKEPGPSNPKSKSVVHLGHDWQVQQTQGKGLKELAIRIKVFLEESFTVDHMIVSRPSYVLNIKDDSVVVSLKDWTSTAVISAIQTAYFGNYLAAIDPSLVHTLIRFDMLAWQIFYQYPPFLSREMNRERDTIIRALTTYFEASPDQRPGEAWFTRSMEKEYRMLGFTDKEIATIMMFTYWG